MERTIAAASRITYNKSALTSPCAHNEAKNSTTTVTARINANPQGLISMKKKSSIKTTTQPKKPSFSSSF